MHAVTPDQSSDCPSHVFFQIHNDFVTEKRRCTPINCSDPNFKRAVQEALQRVPPKEHANLQCTVINLCKFMKKPRGSTSFDSSKNRNQDGTFTDAMIRLAQFYIGLRESGYDYLAQFPLEESELDQLWRELEQIGRLSFEPEHKKTSTPSRVVSFDAQNYAGCAFSTNSSATSPAGQVLFTFVQSRLTSPISSAESTNTQNLAWFGLSGFTSPTSSATSPTGNQAMGFCFSKATSSATNSTQYNATRFTQGILRQPL